LSDPFTSGSLSRERLGVGGDVSSSDLRRVVLSGPGVQVDVGVGAAALGVLATVDTIGAALAAVDRADTRRRSLTGAVSTVLVLGLCLFSGEGYAGVLARVWPLLGAFNPAARIGGPVSAVALSQARARLPVGVLRAVFEAGARVLGAEPGRGQRVFGLLVTAVDGTVFDLAATPAIRARFATPSGGRFPQARVVTLVACGTRRVLAAVLDSSARGEQALWDRLVTRLQPGTLNLADRNFFSMNRWRTAAGTGAHLVWRVKNGARSLPATVVHTLADGSHLVRLRESDAMLSARRKASGETKAPRLQDITARLVEFTVTVTDETGRMSVSRFRVLTTLLDPDAHPGAAIAACYAQRWQVEIVYKTIKTSLRGTGRRLRGQSPDLAEQEIWGLLAIYNAIVEHAVAAAVDLGVDPDEISFTHVLRALRDHLTPAPACANCGQHTAREPADLATAIINGPRNHARRQRASPRTTEERQTQHTRNVTYTIDITEANLPRTT
jgi:Transposase DDE domain/Insertion element 4 transposase N-terminal